MTQYHPEVPMTNTQTHPIVPMTEIPRGTPGRPLAEGHLEAHHLLVDAVEELKKDTPLFKPKHPPPETGFNVWTDDLEREWISKDGSEWALAVPNLFCSVALGQANSTVNEVGGNTAYGVDYTQLTYDFPTATTHAITDDHYGLWDGASEIVIPLSGRYLARSCLNLVGSNIKNYVLLQFMKKDNQGTQNSMANAWLYGYPGWTSGNGNMYGEVVLPIALNAQDQLYTCIWTDASPYGAGSIVQPNPPQTQVSVQYLGPFKDA